LETLCGWINEKKDIGGIVFLTVVPDNGIKPIVAVCKKGRNPEVWKVAKKLKIGSAVRIDGQYAETQISKKGLEFIPCKIVVVSEMSEEKIPIDFSGKTPFLLDTKLDYRYLTLRLPRERAIFIIRSEILKLAREWFYKNGFIEVHTPKLCGAGAEGGATVFELNYFEKKAYLAQSPQLYKQMLMSGLEKVFEITPYFRAEKFSTTRHLNESWGIDMEVGFIDNEEDIMRLLEDLIVHLVEGLAERCSKELKILNVKLKAPEKPFPRIKYDEVLEILRRRGVEIEWGEDLGDREEKILGEEMTKSGIDFYFITKYPWKVKPFYIMRENYLSRSFDLDCKGLELASGGQREHRINELVNNMLEKGLNPKDFEFYLEAFRYAMPPHGGYGLGVERLMMKLLNLENIREAILFPRDRWRLVP